MHPILYDFGFFTLHTYGLMLALGFLAALFFIRRGAGRINADPAIMSDLLIWILGGGIIGARALYCLLHSEEFASPLEYFAIWKGGQVYYGGFLGGLLGSVIFARKRKIKVLDLFDLCLPAAMLGQALGRWGCFMAGCCYGSEVPHEHPLGVAFPVKPDTLIPPALQNPDLVNPSHFLHPTQLYMSLNGLALFLILWAVFRFRKYRGQVTAIFLILYPITRSIVELYRGDIRERVFFGPLSTSQWVGVPLLLLGIYLLITCKKHPVPRAGENTGKE